MGVFNGLTFPNLDTTSDTPDTPDKLPPYSARDNIPSFYSVKGRGIFKGIYNVLDNVGRTVGLTMTGKEKCKGKKIDLRLGNSTFFYNGTCGSESLDGCHGKSRAILVNNTSSKGLIPSLAKDLIDGLNPQNMLDSFDGKGRFGTKCHSIDYNEIQLIPKKKALVKKHSICTPIIEDMTFQFSELLKKKTEYGKRMSLLFICVIVILLLFTVLYRSLRREKILGNMVF